MLRARPAESVSLLVGALVAAVLGIEDEGFPALVAGAVGAVAAVVTAIVDAKDRRSSPTIRRGRRQD